MTKGPSLDPSGSLSTSKIIPLNTVPEGEYGGGTVMLWDEGTWEPIGDPSSSYSSGRLTFILHGKRLKGEWHLVRMGGRAIGKRNNWLLIKSHDEYADKKNGDISLERYDTSAVSGRGMSAIARGDKQWKSVKPRGTPPQAGCSPQRERRLRRRR